MFTVYGFYSIACLRKRDGTLAPDMMMIRARSRSHLHNLKKRFARLAERRIEKWPGRDYGFRMIVPKRAWAAIVGELIMEQTWSNFKDATRAHNRGRDDAYNGALHAVWATMLEVQEPRMRWWEDMRDPADLDVDMGDDAARAATGDVESLQQHFGRHAKPCSDCVDGICAMNCGPAKEV